VSSREKHKRLAARMVRERLARERRRRRAIWTSAGAAILLLVVSLGGYLLYTSQQPDEGFLVPASATADRTGVSVGEGPVTVEVYLDYLCPACREFEADAGETIKRYVADRRITVVYHPVAILDRYSTNEYSSRSAAGAACAADAGGLVAYTDALYANQPAEGGPGHTNATLVEMAAAAGLPRDGFGQCLLEGRYADWVDHVTGGMTRRGVRGTPTVFVDGELLADPRAQTLSAAIDAAGKHGVSVAG
jgi:protein-disulfide isomerase